MDRAGKTSPLLDAALGYAAIGLPVFPVHAIHDGHCTCGRDDCEAPGKHPATTHGLLDATTDKETIRAWNWTHRNVGIRTGNGRIVVDVDPRNGGDRSLGLLQTTCGLLPETVVVNTGGGGQHHWLCAPGVVKGGSDKLGRGIDVKGEGGYVVAPPSVHASGRIYGFAPGFGFDDLPIADAPSWMVEKLLSDTSRSSARTGKEAGPIVELRNNTLAGMAGTMRNRGFSPEAILAALMSENAVNVHPPLSAAEVETIASSYAKYDAGSRPTGGEDEPWPDPLPLGPTANVPTFPVEVLPGRLRSWVTALADALQCPLDLPAMLVLAILSLSCAKKFKVLVRSDWEEPVNLYIVVALKSGESKSPAHAAAIHPLARFVADEQRRLDPAIRAAAARYDIAFKRVEYLKNQTAKEKDPAKRGMLAREVELAVQELAAIEVPVSPRLILDDVTAESLEKVMREQGGRIGILSDEGGPFELMGGRYSDGVPNIDIYLKGHSGSPISTDRIGRTGGSVRNPAITMGLAIQPEVIVSLREKRGFRGRGLLARFLWSVPISRVGNRAADCPAMPEEVRKGYEDAVLGLLRAPSQRDDHGEIVSRAIPLDEGAYTLLVEFKGKIEPLLGPSGALEVIADWGNKLPGSVVRIAALLHLADRALEPERRLEAIGTGEMKRAIGLAQYLCVHARIAFDMMEADPVTGGARKILAWLQRTGVSDFTRRSAYQSLRASFKSPSELDQPLDLLVDHEILRRRPTPDRAGPGRPASPTFDVNPALQARNAQNAQNSVLHPEDLDSVHSVHGLGLLGSEHCDGDRLESEEGF